MSKRADRQRWKAAERRVAKFFGTKRTPLSGSMSGHTSSDTLHPRLYIEVKTAAGPTGTNGWIWKLLRGRSPLQKRYSYEYGLYLIHSSQLGASCLYLVDVNLCAACRALYADTEKKALKEHKCPVVVLVQKGHKGFWVIAAQFGLHMAGVVREEVLRVQEA